MYAAPQIANPDAAQAHYTLGLQEQAAGRLDAAILQFDAALRLKPDFPEALNAGGFILQQRGHIAGALAFYGRAAEIAPDDFMAQFNLGSLWLSQCHHDRAIACLARACALKPDHAGAHVNYGAALAETGRLSEAVEIYAQALALDSNLSQAALNLGNALMRLGRYGEARDSYRRALALRPNYLLAHVGYGIVSKEMGCFQEAMASYDCALALDPTSIEARGNRGCLQLLLGDFARGWEGYEDRWAEGERPVPASPARFDLASPQTFAGRSVLVVNDHGIGDSIQFFRYVALLAKGGAHVTFAGPAKLRRLLASCGADVQWRDETHRGDYDATLAISSLPRACGARLDTIPAPIPYLHPEPGLRDRWREKLAGPGLKIGLCWRGSQDFRVDPRRSIPPEALAPLAQIENARFFALQKDVAPDELPEALRARVKIFGEGYDDGADAFVDTAAIMGELDLVISCDTSTAHLSGAIGRPVWLALRHVAEWRWMTERADSPWYPTMRLFRCGAGDDWRGLFETMAAELNRRADRDGAPS